MKSILGIFLLAALLLTGCVQSYSDCDMRTVPATNNPLYIPKNNSTPGLGF